MTTEPYLTIDRTAQRVVTNEARQYEVDEAIPVTPD